MTTEKKSYSNAEAKAIVQKALNIPKELNDLWNVRLLKNSTQPLALAHANTQPKGSKKGSYFTPDDRSQAPLRAVRGNIVDLETGMTVAGTLGFTESLPMYSPLVKDEDGSISYQGLKTTYFHSVKDDPKEVPKKNRGKCVLSKDVKLFAFYEGVFIRIWKFRGKVFVSTHRNIDATHSFWGYSRPFIELFKEVGGPEPTSLFGEEPTSPYTHFFLVAHNELRISSSTSDNRLVYVGTQKNWDEKVHAAKGGVYEYDGEIKLVTPEVKVMDIDIFSPSHLRGNVYDPEINMDIANKILFPHKFAKEAPKDSPVMHCELVYEFSKDGKSIEEVHTKKYQDNIDEKMAGGDPVIAYTKNEKGETVIYRLEPPGFTFRNEMTDDEPNFYFRFVENMAYFTTSEGKDIRNYYPMFSDDDGKPLDYSLPRVRQAVWYNIFALSVPPALQEQVSGYLDKYYKDIRSVADFILNEFSKINNEIELKQINPESRERIRALISVAQDSAKKNGSTTRNTVIE